MQTRVIELVRGKYIECISAETPLCTEQDALELMALCGANGTQLLMLHAASLSGDFFKLKTGVAGGMLQKFVNYRVKAAIVLAEGQLIMGRFKELQLELHRGSDFRVFHTRAEAEDWLGSLQ